MSTHESPGTPQQYYPSKDICNEFDISSSTLRKWCIALEKQGYEFTRTEQNRRLFTKDDLQALQGLRDLIQSKGMSLENAATIAGSKFSGTRSSSVTPSVHEELEAYKPDQKVMDVLLEHIESQNEYIKNQENFNEELLRKLDEQNARINDHLEKRDRMLTEAMNNFTEERKKEVKLLEEVKEEEKKGFWAKLFNK